MPRQPLLPGYRNAKLRFPSDVLAERPELAKIVGQCIGIWAQIEVQMALMLSALMKPRSDAAVAFFLSIRNSRLQREGLTLAANNVLSGGYQLEVFEAMSVIYQSLESQRNDLVHGVYALSENHPDILVWFEPSKHANFFANTFDKIAKQEAYSLDEIKKDGFAYRAKDLDELREALQELWQLAMAFASHLRVPESQVGEALFLRQCALPRVQQEISRLKLARENTQPVQPSQPEPRPNGS
jgi:hypothetical protein